MFDQKYYSVKHKNKEILKKSSSGGLFTALSDVVLDQSGIVIGGGYDFNTNEVVFKICRSVKERDSLRGSKYIQGNMTQLYRQIEEEIEHQIAGSCSPIMFVGLPCQVAALKNYLKIKEIEYPRLILCDLVCHGVPSLGVWQYFFEKKCKKIAPNYITFKDKKLGWSQPLAFASNEDKRVSLRAFTLLYFGKLIMRPSCHECPYSSTERIGDISLGDHWSVGKVDPGFCDKNGVSLAILNSEKGYSLFESCKNDIEWRLRTREECLQQALEYPVTENSLRKFFWAIYRVNKGISIVLFDAIVALEKVIKKIVHF